jgi:ankyrin repeat protein
MAGGDCGACSVKWLVVLLGACSSAAAPVPPQSPTPTSVVAAAPVVEPAPEPPAPKNNHRCPSKLVNMTDVEEIRALIRAEKCNGNAYDSFGYSALMRAAKAGRIDIVRELIAAGTDVDDGLPPGMGSHDTGKNALWFAVSGDHPEIVAALLKAGADPNGGPSQGLSMLRLAALNESAACAKLLVEAGAEKDAAAMTYNGGPSAQVFAYLESVGIKADGLPEATQESLRWEATTKPAPAEVAIKTKSSTARKFAIKHLADEPPEVAVPALVAVATGPSIDKLDWGPHDAIFTLQKFEWTAEQDKALPTFLSMIAADKRQQVRLQLLSLVAARAPLTKPVVDTLLARLERGEDRANAAMALGEVLKRADAPNAKRIRKALERAAKGPTGDCKGAEQCARHQTTEAARKALGS